MSNKITIRLNNIAHSIDENPTWTPANYANAFKTALEPMFPGFVFIVTPEGRLRVDAPKGEALYLSSSGSSFTPGVDVRVSNSGESEPVIVVIKSGVADQTYRLSLNGAEFLHKTGTTEQADTWVAETIAKVFQDKLTIAGYQVKRYGQVLTIKTPDNTPISFDYSDTWNSQAMYAARGRVAAIDDLPPRLDPNVVLAVGDVRSGGYYLKFAYRDSQVATSVGTSEVNRAGDYSGFTNLTPTLVTYPTWEARESGSAGIYEETYRPGTRTTFNKATMPHALIREADGSFTFKPIDWGVRKVGDEQSVPAPSFISKKIHDVFFFRNRLGFLTDENIILSKAGLFFDFWPDTAKEVLDSDPIDLLVSSTKISILRHAEPFNSSLLVFGDTAQWIVTAQGAMTPRTVNVQPSTAFNCSAIARPVSIGQTVYFTSERGPWSSVWEYYVMQDSFQNTASEITQHVPKYISSGVRQLVGAPSENLLAVTTSGDPKALYVYKYLWSGDQKVQESWSRWTFSGSIVNTTFMGSILYAVFKHSDGLYLEKIDLQDTEDMALVDRRGHNNWQPFTMVYELSPVYLKDGSGQNLIGSKDILRNIRIFYSNLNHLKIAVACPYRSLHVRSFPDKGRTEFNRSPIDNGDIRMAVSGDAKTTRISLVNDSPMQCRIQGIEFELMSTSRSRRV